MSDNQKANTKLNKAVSKKLIVLIVLVAAIVTGLAYLFVFRDGELKETEASLRINQTYESDRLVEIKEELKQTDDIESLYKLTLEAGNLYFGDEYYEDSARLYEAAAQYAGPNEKLSAYYLAGQAFIGVGDVEKVISAYERAIANKTAEQTAEADKLQVEVDEMWKPRLVPVQEYNAEAYEASKNDGSDGNVP